MKIAFVNKYQNKVSRGAETFVSELSTHLSKHHEVDVLTSVGRLFGKRYDVVIPTNGRLQVFIVRFVTWLTHSKMVVSGQSGPGFDDRLNLYAFPDIFVGLTKYQSDWAKKINHFVKIETIPNGVDLNKFSEPKVKPTDVILSVGAFTKEKRHDLTISAVAKLKDIKLIIAGGGGDQKEVITNLGLRMLGKERFEVLGVPHDKMPEVYKKATVLAFPTVPWESFGIAMVEAMSTDLPVVATNDPIRREIIGGAGILVDPTDTDEYARALQKALDLSWGEIPRKQAEKFSWEVVAKKYESLFKNINS